MTNPITPPPELVEQWLEKARREIGATAYNLMGTLHYCATQAAQWGADQELEACVALVNDWAQRLGYPHYGAELRLGRRPKPPTLKEQALAKTTAILNDPNRALLVEVRETLELNLLALEALPND
jgi:hypothetical protein